MSNTKLSTTLVTYKFDVFNIFAVKYLIILCSLALVSCGQNSSQEDTSTSLLHLFERVSTVASLNSSQLTTTSNATSFPAPNTSLSVLSTSAISFYAASRFLEQAAWGPTPQEVANVQRLGFSTWIDQQMSLPPTLANAPNYVINYTPNDGVTDQRAYNWWPSRFYAVSTSGPDQLRLRVTWAIYNFIPENNGNAYATPSYFDVLQNNVLTTYPQLMTAITLSPAMGDFLNLNQDRAGSPNENYAREVMQLFSVGMVLLNPDGSVIKDAKGNPVQTYSQNDVINATKALSGWQDQWINSPSNGSNYGYPMIAKYPGDHDTSAKVVLGSLIPANQTAQLDLNSFVSIITKHPNTAPFVSRRIIQNMVSSNPSPAYIARVAQVFSSSNGDLKQVVKAILLDPEARLGDDPVNNLNTAGKIKEPILVFNELFRALGCLTTVYDRNNLQNAIWTGQSALSAPNVFGYFSPDHKAPVSLYTTPEETLFTINSLNAFNGLPYQLAGQGFLNAGCQIGLFTSAMQNSNGALIELFNQRFFRGNMPTSIRGGFNSILTNNIASYSPTDKLGYLLGLILSSPIYGVVK